MFTSDKGNLSQMEQKLRALDAIYREKVRSGDYQSAISITRAQRALVKKMSRAALEQSQAVQVRKFCEN